MSFKHYTDYGRDGDARDEAPRTPLGAKRRRPARRSRPVATAQHNGIHRRRNKPSA
jgi:hypothetical protein